MLRTRVGSAGDGSRVSENALMTGIRVQTYGLRSGGGARGRRSGHCVFSKRVIVAVAGHPDTEAGLE